MNRLTAVGVLGVLIALPGLSATKISNPKLDPVLHAVEQRYNSAKTLSVRFTESYIAGKRVKRTETGTLELRKPGKMRWDYSSPAGKWFLSDGKSFFLYSPDTQRVERSSAHDTGDLHAPLAFLLGKLNFYKEFSGFQLRGEGDGTWIDAEPTSPTLPYSKVEFLVTADARIRRLRVTSDDLSVLDFTFEDEHRNPALDPKRFVFKLPAGAAFEDNSQ